MYITRVDLLTQLTELQLVQLTDDEKNGVANDGRVDKAITDAEAECNGYFATKYKVPIEDTVGSPLPQLVKKLATDVAVWNLWRRRQRVPDDVSKAYDVARETLQQIAKGLVTLGVDIPPADSHQASAGETFGPERVFDRDGLKSF